MAAPPSGFLAAHVARGTRNVLKIGVALTVLGLGMTWLFDNPFPLFVALPGVVALGVWVYRRMKPEAHPAYTGLARFGDPAQVAAEVEAAFAGVPIDEAVRFSADWLAQGDTYGVHVVPWREVAWIHLYTRVQNGFPSHFVRVWTRDGRTFVIPVGRAEGEKESMLAQLYARAPWAEVGYSPEKLKEWQRERAAVLARVDARRASTPTA